MSFYHNYIGTLSIPTAEKEALLDPKMLSEHHLYLHLISYLAPAFPEISAAQLESLSLSSYLYFRFLLSFDQLIDTSRFSLSEMRLGFEFYEKAIRGLAALYPNDSPFWEQFSSLKSRYFTSLISEKKGSTNKIEMTPEIFQEIAIGKSAMSLAAVDSLTCLAGSTAMRDELIDCISQLHIGLQYMDDIDDFKLDFKEGQWTYPMSLTHIYLKQNGIVTQDPTLLHTYLYVSGIAQKNLGLAIAHFEKSALIASSAGLSSFASFLEQQITSCQSHLQEVEDLFLKTEIKSQKSFSIVKNNSINSSLENALGYLEKNIDDSTEWTDFMTSAGQSTSWTSAYIGMQLAEINHSNPLLKPVLQKVLTNASNSFNEAMIQDGDSSSFLVGFQQKMGYSSDLSQRDWLAFMNADGGWVTYRDPMVLRKKLDIPFSISVEGWTNSHTCVSAAATYVLAGIPSLRLDYEISCLHMASLLENKNHWSSYWWTSDVYATSFAIQALAHHPEIKSRCESPALWLAHEQETSGYWSNPATQEPSAFYTALAIKALHVHNAKGFDKSIAKGVDWILKNQMTDGSWLTSRILRIPATDVLDPSTVKRWRKSSFGVNCIVDDHNRLFTTSTVLNTLHQLTKSTVSC
jgi:hypothetical protein